MTRLPPPTSLPLGPPFQQRLRDCLLAFSRPADARSTLPRALATMAVEAAALTGAARATIWLYDRRSRDLWLAADSEMPDTPSAQRVPAADVSAPPAFGLTLAAATWSPDAPGAIVAPLRGWRRALGTLVLEGPTLVDLSADDVLELAHDVAHQLSAAVENLLLLEEVIRQHHLVKGCFNSLLDPLVVVDKHLRVVQTNEALARTLQRAQNEILERPLEAAVGQEIARWIADPLTGGHDAGDSAATGTRARTHTFNDSPLGRTVVVTVTPLVSDATDMLGQVIVARDITRQLQLEADRELLRGKLAQHEKLAALGHFVAGVAHEINNPLQGVLGNVQLLLRSGHGAPIEAELRQVLYEADRAAQIVRNLLAFSASRQTVRRRVAIEGIVEAAISARQPSMAEHNIEVVRHHLEGPLHVIGDPLRLEQALSNVLINAEQAVTQTGRPGVIEIATAPGEDGRLVVTRVRDTGMGFDPAVLGRIYDPFFTTKEVDKGSGLGLTIVYGIVQEHGGSVRAANAAEGGAVVTLELPAAEDEATQPVRRHTAGDA